MPKAGARKAKFAASHARCLSRKESRRKKLADKMEKLADKRKALRATIKTKEGPIPITAFSTGLTMARFRSRYIDKVDKEIRRRLLDADADPIHTSTDEGYAT